MVLKYFIITLLTLCGGTGFLCGLAIWLPQVDNNQHLQRFADELYNYPLPPQTEVVEQNATVTLLGNGNHCDFVATQSLTYWIEPL